MNRKTRLNFWTAEQDLTANRKAMLNRKPQDKTQSLTARRNLILNRMARLNP